MTAALARPGAWVSLACYPLAGLPAAVVAALGDWKAGVAAPVTRTVRDDTGREWTLTGTADGVEVARVERRLRWEAGRGRWEVSGGR